MKYTVNHDIAIVRVCGKNILVAAGRARGSLPGATKLNDSGAFFWRLIAEGRDEQAIIDLAAAEYDIPRETAAESLSAFLDTLARNGFVRLEAPEDAT